MMYGTPGHVKGCAVGPGGPPCRDPLLMHYAAVRDPASLPITARCWLSDQTVRPTVLSYLTREQVAAMLAAPDRHTWSAHRDAALLTTTYKTGACLGTHRTART
jgi:hypothetical protein